MTKRRINLEMPMPSYMLTKNYSNSHGTAAGQKRIRGVAARHREDATNAALAYVVPSQRPFFPAGVRIRVTCYIERGKRANRWDKSAVIEALKSYMDGFEGNEATGPIVYPNDEALDWGDITWDEKPTRPIPGDNRIYITLEEVEAIDRVPRTLVTEIGQALARANEMLGRVYESTLHAPYRAELREIAEQCEVALADLGEVTGERGGE